MQGRFSVDVGVMIDTYLSITSTELFEPTQKDGIIQIKTERNAAHYSGHCLKKSKYSSMTMINNDEKYHFLASLVC